MCCVVLSGVAANQRIVFLEAQLRDANDSKAAKDRTNIRNMEYIRHLEQRCEGRSVLSDACFIAHITFMPLHASTLALGLSDLPPLP